MHTRTDTAILEMADLGEFADSGRDLLDHVYDEHARALFRYAKALLGSSDDAEDAVQDVFVRLARDVKRIRRIEDLQKYLFKATRNAAYSILRSRKRQERFIEDALSCAPETPGCETGILLELFAQLPPEQREALALKVFSGFTFREIGEVIGKSQNTISSRYRYAIERLRSAIGSDDNET